MFQVCRGTWPEWIISSKNYSFTGRSIPLEKCHEIQRRNRGRANEQILWKGNRQLCIRARCKSAETANEEKDLLSSELTSEIRSTSAKEPRVPSWPITIPQTFLPRWRSRLENPPRLLIISGAVSRDQNALRNEFLLSFLLSGFLYFLRTFVNFIFTRRRGKWRTNRAWWKRQPRRKLKSSQERERKEEKTVIRQCVKGKLCACSISMFSTIHNNKILYKIYNKIKADKSGNAMCAHTRWFSIYICGYLAIGARRFSTALRWNSSDAAPVLFEFARM